MVAKTSDPIAGPQRGSIAEALDYGRERGAKRWKDFEQYVHRLSQLCSATGLDFAVAFGQFCDETGTGTSYWWDTYLNPAGIGALETLEDNGKITYVGLKYKNGTEAAEAHVVHLYLYAKGLVPSGHVLEPFVRLDPRYQAAQHFAGKALTIEYLATRWAANPNYHNQIVAHMNKAFPTLPNQAGTGNQQPTKSDVWAVTGGKQYPIAQYQQQTEFSKKNCSMYRYGEDLGLFDCEHPGWDIGMPEGTALYAPSDGTVIQSGNSPYYVYRGRKNVPGEGHFVLVRPNGDEIILGHCKKIVVTRGDQVRQGQLVAYSGYENGAHLHLEVRVKGRYAWGTQKSVSPGEYDFGAATTRPDPITPGRTPITFAQSLIPRGAPNYRSEKLLPGGLWIVVHNTGNPSSTAAGEATFVSKQGGGPFNVSPHLVNDGREIYQMVPVNVRGWHAGDGCDNSDTDIGCFRGVAIENCEPNPDAVEENLAKLIAALVVGDERIAGWEPGRFSLDRVTTHNQVSNDGKNCPRIIRQRGTLDSILQRARAYVAAWQKDLPNVEPVPPITPVQSFQIGTTVKVADGPLNLRAGAGTNQRILKELAVGAQGVIKGGTKTGSGYVWQQADFARTVGWVAVQYLQKVADPEPPAEVPPIPPVVPPPPKPAPPKPAPVPDPVEEDDGWTLER